MGGYKIPGFTVVPWTSRNIVFLHDSVYIYTYIYIYMSSIVATLYIITKFVVAFTIISAFH